MNIYKNNVRRNNCVFNLRQLKTVLDGYYWYYYYEYPLFKTIIRLITIYSLIMIFGGVPEGRFFCCHYTVVKLLSGFSFCYPILFLVKNLQV